jgi:methylenetetrahydrofolate dehydrogenase (NADP+) / methenyltetrahydrofolate cyclohydrolase
MQILDGKLKSFEILSEQKSIIAKNNLTPILDMILVGDNPASIKYTNMKQSSGKSIGINGTIHKLSADISELEIINLIHKLNKDPKVTAIMIQLPLPEKFNTEKIINTIDPSKDADGLTALNLGRLFQKHENVLVSATPLGIIKLLDKYDINISGKNAVIINRSPFIGLSLAALFTNANATVTICHSRTKNTKELCQAADIIVSGTGKPNYLTEDFVKDGAIVIDVGMEVDFENVKSKCSFITPPTGGVGPMTVASLLANTVKIALNNN